MGRKKRKKQLPQFSILNAAYCSGFFVDDDAFVTTMCLLFDRIWFLNHLESVSEFSKKFRFQFNDDDPKYKVEIKPASPDAEGEDPFPTLTPFQRETAMKYLYAASRFCIHYHELLEEHVICTDLFPNGEVLNVELIKKGPPGGLNTYRVTPNSMLTVSGADTVEELDTLISQGAVPLLSKKFGGVVPNSQRSKPRYLSSLLAMKAVELTFPQMKPANAETILEARERLQDLLPLFWGSMFRLSTDFREHMKQSRSLREIERECEDYIDTNVRPALIELSSKLEKDRKNWFHKILSATAKETKLIISKPPLTMAGLVSSGLQLGANVTLDVAQGEFASHETGLMYLIELDKLMRKRD